MKLLSIDLETTGLEAETDQILQLGAVWDDGTDRPIHELPTFSRYVMREGCRYEGNIHALHMNAHTLAKLASIAREPNWRHRKQQSCYVVGDDELVREFRAWIMATCSTDSKGKITITSKNCGKMEYQFLRRLPDFNVDHIFHHRFLDPGSLMVTGKDEYVPDTAECARRAGISTHVAHDALADAIQQIEIVRAAFNFR